MKPIKREVKRRIIERTQYNAGGTQCVEVDVCGIMSGNAVERSMSQVEAIRSLTKGEGTRYDVILCKMGVVGKI